MKRFMRNSILAMLLAAIFAVGVKSATSEVTGVTFPGYFDAGRISGTSMVLISPDSVDGINGEMTFDPALFSNPLVLVDTGSPGYTALGNQTAPGVFRFILYKNPADTSLDLTKPVIEFVLTPIAVLHHSTQSTVNFTMSAAARVVPGTGGASTAVSITPTTFQPFTIFIGGSKAKDWVLYE